MRCSWFSAGKDFTVRLWDRETGKEIIHFDKHEGPVNGLAFTRDGHRAFSAGGDQSVRMWQLPR